MAKICDRSPCDSLMDALGHYIFGSPEGFVMLVAIQGFENDPASNSEVPVGYCPFCGTRLEEVGTVVVERFTRPRRRRAKAASA